MALEGQYPCTKLQNSPSDWQRRRSGASHIPIHIEGCQTQANQQLEPIPSCHWQTLPPCAGLSQPQAKDACPTSPRQAVDTHPGPTTDSPVTQATSSVLPAVTWP